jgi:radical SAM superfamily enzyme YgiQ (UPF0313 family)
VTDVLLGQSYYLRFDPKLWEAQKPYPPLGTMYAASWLRSRGYVVAMFDAMLADSEDEWGAALERSRPRIAVLFEDSFNYLSKMCLGRMRRAALAMIDRARAAGAVVIACGSDASDHADVYLSGGASFVIVGEGELTLRDLVDRLTGQSGARLATIPGLAYVGEGGQILRTPPRPDIDDLDRLPHPAWDLVDVPRYRRIWRERHGYFSVNLVTTRGCPYRCNWCAKPIWGQRYNVRSPVHVVEEIAWLKRTCDPDHLCVADDIMGLRPGWMAAFADLVRAEGVRMPFKCLSRADLLLRPGEVEALSAAGAHEVWIGAESGSQKILDAMEKGITVEQILDASRRLHRAGIRVGFFLQFGYPGETRSDIDRTLEMIRRGEPDDIGISVSYPLPGTKFYERVKQDLGDKQNWDDSSDLAMLYRGPYSTAFYRQLHLVVHKEFRARKAWRDLAAAVRRPRTLRPRHGRQAVAMVYHAGTVPFARRDLDRLAQIQA